MPHQFMIIDCKHCGETYCPVCKKLCSVCGKRDIADDDTEVMRTRMRLADARAEAERPHMQRKPQPSDILRKDIVDYTGNEHLSLGMLQILALPLLFEHPTIDPELLHKELHISLPKAEEVVRHMHESGFVTKFREEMIIQAAEIEDNDYQEQLDKARDIVSETGKVSVSLIQRRLKIGYARAARLIDDLTMEGTVAPEDNHNWD